MLNAKTPEEIKAILKWAAWYCANATTIDEIWWNDFTEELARAITGTLPE